MNAPHNSKCSAPERQKKSLAAGGEKREITLLTVSQPTNPMKDSISGGGATDDGCNWLDQQQQQLAALDRQRKWQKELKMAKESHFCADAASH